MQTIKVRARNLIFNVIVKSTFNKYTKDSYHLDYESEKYRQAHLIDLIRDTVIFFALTREELASISAETIAQLQKRAWRRISERPPKIKGDYGELLLFLILEAFYPAKKFVTKIRLRTSLGDEIKGFDCAHFSIEGGEICLWLGEAKFHQNFSGALSSVVESLNDHITDKMLKNEISILEGNNTELEEQDRIKIEKYLNSGITLDKMKFKIPILITYDSKTVKGNKSVCKEFTEQLMSELTAKYKTIDGKSVTLKPNIELHFIIIPLETVKEIKEKLQLIETAFK
jgi:hypothetical protein